MLGDGNYHEMQNKSRWGEPFDGKENCLIRATMLE